MSRPPLSDALWRIIPCSILLLAGIGAAIAVDLTANPTLIPRIAIYVFAGLIALMCLKEIAIGVVVLYQRYAKEETRCQCRFEPSCSNYMILALGKYGLILGLIKGIRRIARCHPPNGGVDYP